MHRNLLTRNSHRSLTNWCIPLLVLLALSADVRGQTSSISADGVVSELPFSSDLTVWPNLESHANSDSWLALNHDQLQMMKPRVLLINFSNDHSADKCLDLARKIITALAESSRYQGYNNAAAPIFLEYEIFHFVDLRDSTQANGNSLKLPVKDPKARSGFNVKYDAFFLTEFAEQLNIRDAKNPNAPLTLTELLERGWVHEVWFFESGNGNSRIHSGAYEVVELKPQYDKSFKKIDNQYVQAGNGGDSEQRWTGRSCRIGCINASRGVGCYLESLAHGLEGTSSSKAIPYFTEYFREYAGYDLQEKYQLPFESFYSLDYRTGDLQYPTSSSLQVVHAGKKFVVNGYVAVGGNAHFPPNGRKHYDLDNSDPVLSTIEDWRIGSGPGGEDVRQPFTSAKFERYRDLAPDCMGRWLVYWRQNMPGLNNRQKDNAGKPMKNWIPFLFY